MTRPDPHPETQVVRKSSLHKLALHAWHERAGAEFRGDRGYQVPWSYASASAPPVRAGLLDLSNQSRLELVGPDRQRFLGGLVTSAVADLKPGTGVYGFVTSIKGKVLADTVVSAFEDRLFLLLPPGQARQIREHLSKYIVADRVEVLPLQDLLPIALVGDEIVERLPAGAWPDEPWGCGVIELFGTQLPVSRHERLGLPALVCWISSSIVEPVVRELVDRLDLSLVGHRVTEEQRVALGLPGFGIDFDENSLAQESGIEAIDFTKGCYLGQEVIARLHYRGKVPKIVRRLVWEGDVEVPAGAPVEFEDRRAGALTTVVGNVGLGMIQRRAAEPGTVVSVHLSENGSSTVEARVEAL